jgi:CRISPR/Cas system-associated protein endoribonuclease Cas2
MPFFKGLKRKGTAVCAIYQSTHKRLLQSSFSQRLLKDIAYMQHISPVAKICQIKRDSSQMSQDSNDIFPLSPRASASQVEPLQFRQRRILCQGQSQRRRSFSGDELARTCRPALSSWFCKRRVVEKKVAVSTFLRASPAATEAREQEHSRTRSAWSSSTGGPIKKPPREKPHTHAQKPGLLMKSLDKNLIACNLSPRKCSVTRHCSETSPQKRYMCI